MSVRDKHIDLINKLESEFAKNPSQELGKRIERYYEQLKIYDMEVEKQWNN